MTCKFINADEPSILFVDPYDVQCIYLWDYCEFNPVMFFDSDGYYALALASGGFWVAGGVNWWNPVGWAILGTTAIASVGASIYYYKEHSSTKNGKKANKHEKGNARRQRDQGGEKKKQKTTWKRYR